MVVSPALSVELAKPGSLAELGAAWQGLERDADGSFFQSWHWIGAWLRNIPDNLHLKVARISGQSGLVGLGVLVFFRRRRRALFISRGAYLNETGDERLDNLTIEHNGLLVVRNQRAEVQAALLRHLWEQGDSWDELFVGGTDECLDDAAKDALGSALVFRVERQRTCYFTRLAGMPTGLGGYLDSLSSNTRYQIRRAIRKYEQTAGPLSVEVARTASDAQEFLSRLRELHQEYWTARGQPGSFADPFFERFHRDLIDNAFDAGAIQLMSIKAGSDPVGYLYNFMYRGTVYNYQSGFRYTEDAALKPGMVAHALAVAHNAEAGATVYDFLAGDQQYKRSLATGEQPMYWFVGQKRRAKFWIEDAAVAMIRNLRRIRGIQRNAG